MEQPKPLAGWLREGASRGKKDTVTALFNLLTHTDNCLRVINAGVVTPLVGAVGVDDYSSTLKLQDTMSSQLDVLSQGTTMVDEEEDMAASLVIEMAAPETEWPVFPSTGAKMKNSGDNISDPLITNILTFH
ncbi:hypothetical protein Nepgr_022053 [Nepenthes gracilis]|uniref:Uncharacterized protein n=1 Tax=Nepenthes gracilis TaxID=150966 RepID=A0AAD3T069_NEPGR|nr:hypothetical protein Nepgr_022053 [Nepenthes gracilis]